MDEYLQTLKFKTFAKVAPQIKKKFPGVTDKEIREALKTKVKDTYISPKQQRPLMIKIFANSIGCWFHDIFENQKNTSPRYFHIFIGANNRYAVANPLPDKNSQTILASYKQFDKRFAPYKLTSDQDSSLLSEECLKFLKSRDILVQSIPDQNHSALGIIDRFIRTLRDIHNSRNFTNQEMQQLINVYNNTNHLSIGCSPKKMFKNKKLEEKYILGCLDAKARQETRKDFRLKEGTWVRYILPKAKLEKKRTRLSPEKYKIDGYDGNLYIIAAKDGSVLSKPRFQLVPCSDNVPWAQTTGKRVAVLDKIVKPTNAKKSHYRVIFRGPDGKDDPDTVPASYLRNRLDMTADIRLK
jgi:hypothetical protein